MKIKIVGARLAFPVLFNPEQFQGEGEEMYSCSLLVGPDRNVKVFVGEPRDGGGVNYTKKIGLADALEEVGKAKWKDKWPQVKKASEAKDMNFLHDGDAKANYAGFAGNYFVSCRSPAGARPKVVDERGNPLTQRDGRIYAGCYVVALIELWAQDNGFGKRINAQIRGVQFYRDGDAFSGAAPASDDEFDDVSEGADADDIG